MAPGSPFLDKLVRKSPFSTAIMHDIVGCASSDLPEDQVTEELRQSSRKTFQAWGQMKVVEDGIGKVRGVEQRVSLTRASTQGTASEDQLQQSLRQRTRLMGK